LQLISSEIVTRLGANEDISRRVILAHLRDFYLPKLLILRPRLFFSQKIPLRSMVFFFELVVVPYSLFLTINSLTFEEILITIYT
jgi:hypothetical protein